MKDSENIKALTRIKENYERLWQENLAKEEDVKEEYDAVCAGIKALESTDVLDKIRVEILDEAEYAYSNFDGYKYDILHAEPDELPDDDFRYGMERAVEIIDKYKAESEEVD